ncbi:MAG: DUF2065 domain-containing protein [Burkholderiaceae bacterium]
MNSESLWLALALVLIIEGLFPFISPTGWRQMFQKILLLQDGQIRFFGICSVLAGTFLLWFLN